jgi:creatinine amidohydrolase/Fe(II)-dependent formamide hydrolase-like protein
VFLCRSRERFPKVLRIVALCSKSTRPLTSQNFVVYTRQTSWRAHAGRRKVREERARRERERREWAVARVGGAVCGWWARRWARAEAEEAARMVREEAATRMHLRKNV